MRDNMVQLLSFMVVSKTNKSFRPSLVGKSFQAESDPLRD